MGYSEIHCHICGVSFNISRARTETEPRSAAWGQERDYPDRFHPECCPDEPGCFWVDRYADGNEDAEEPETALLEPVKMYPADIDEDDFDADDWEHISGPKCNQGDAYNGHNISVEAMRGCKTSQCLIRKPDDWEPEPDDEEFEVSGHFFLSGLNDSMPSRDMSCPEVVPERHGNNTPNADNCVWNADDAEDYCMPFHPTCFEVFKRVTLHRYGVVDIECLTQWWAHEANYEDFHAFPRHPAVENGQQQSWNHDEGGEFLAANPCFVPGLEALLSSAHRPKELGHADSELIPTAVSAATHPRDLFSRLPGEVRMFILLQLGFKDIANLRLASRTFLQLPRSLFYELTLRDTPWLYEAWSSLPISYWATSTQEEEEKKQKDRQDRVAALNSALEILEDEAVDSGDPDANDAAIEAIEAELETLSDIPTTRPATSVILLNRTETDWYRLQTEIGRNWKKLQGLQNRRRIWNDCQEILNRVDAYRKQGRIRRGQAVDIVGMARRAQEIEAEKGRRWARYCAAGRQGPYNPEDWA
ncbi:hypothetical protein CDV31_012432 [Fusarium ambrosium]|uniref:F-box domain-containing protein n=1 Tax=Fusarium ambrosium TaxID=131363 RepID=A0A428T9T6_9HYPO|nr:hypothetical protein CDV31_012432 [Fusarium ambrosium]